MTEALVSIAPVDEREVLGRTLDLSRGGIRFQCPGLDVQPGDLLRVNLSLAGRQISVLGKLVRLTELDGLNQEFALAFVEADAESIELLQEIFGDHEI